MEHKEVEVRDVLDTPDVDANAKIDEAIQYLRETRLGKKYPKWMLKGLKLKQRDTKKKISASDRKAKRKAQKSARKVNR